MQSRSKQKAVSLLLALTMAAGLALPVLAEETPETAAADAAPETLLTQEPDLTESASTEPDPTEPDLAQDEAAAYDADDTGNSLKYTVNDDGASCTITYCSHALSGEIAIPSTLDGYTVTGIGYEAFAGQSSLTDITLPDSVTSIADRAFVRCSSLTSITLPNRVTSIGDEAFLSCSSLTGVTIPDSVTSIGDYAFNYCTVLASITVSDANTAYTSQDGVLFDKNQTRLIRYPEGKSGTAYALPDSVTQVGSGAFDGCINLASITASDANTAYTSQDGVLFNKDRTTLTRYPEGKVGTTYEIPNSVTRISGGAFYDCASLTSITIPNGVTGIGASAFSGCSSLTDITIPNNVRSIGTSAFAGCSALAADITIPNGVTSIADSTFSGCSSLTGVSIPDSVTSIGASAFADCSALASDITIPSGVTSIADRTFSGCSALSGVAIPNGVTSIGAYAFDGCSSLPSVTIPDSVTSIGASAFADCSALASDITIPTGVTSIADYTFYGCSSLSGVAIPNGVTSIGAYAFCGCSLLSSVTIPDSVSSIGKYAFFGCKALTSITIPDGVTSIEQWTFGECGALVSIKIPTSAANVAENAFTGCKALTDVCYTGSETDRKSLSIAESNDDLLEAIWHYNYTDPIYPPTFITSDGVSYITNYDGKSCTIADCDASVGGELVLPSEISDGTEKYAVTRIWDNAFEGCDALTDITLPDGVIMIRDSAFSGCRVLASIMLPDGLASIGENAFYDCRSLELITLPDSLTSIGTGAFGNCNALAGIRIPVGVTQIEDWTFGSNDTLTDVYYGGSETERASLSVGGYNENLLKARWHYNYAGSLVPAQSFVSGVLTYTTNYDGTTCKVTKCDTNAEGKIEIPEKISEDENEYSVEEIKNSAFADCWSLTGVTVPDGVTIIGECAFDACYALTSVSIPNSVTSIGQGAFRDCRVLTDIAIPDNVTAIQGFTFQSCSSLTSAAIPDGVTSIGQAAFNGSGLTCIAIPKSVTEIADAAFMSCGSLTDVYYAGSEEDRASLSIGQSNENLSNAVWHYNYTEPIPTAKPTAAPTAKPTAAPTAEPTAAPTAEPTAAPTAKPTAAPTAKPTAAPTAKPTVAPTAKPTAAPTAEPTAEPTATPTPTPVQNGWRTIGGKDYWYENGVRQGTTGRGKEIYDPGSNGWYWLDAVQGGAKAVSKEVFQEYADGNSKWVRYDADGHMIKGWYTNSSGTYYYDLTTGAMQYGLVTIDGLPCAFDSTTGVGLNLQWVSIGGKDYWYENGKRQGYDPNNAAYRGKEIYDPTSNGWYWLDNVQQGAKATSKDVYQESGAGQWAANADGTGKWVRYDADGHMIKGWQTTGKGTYYFDPIYGTMAKNTVTIDGKTYRFDGVTGILQ